MYFRKKKQQVSLKDAYALMQEMLDVTNTYTRQFGWVMDEWPVGAVFGFMSDMNKIFGGE